MCGRIRIIGPDCMFQRAWSLPRHLIEFWDICMTYLVTTDGKRRYRMQRQ